jgi:hypothetical protein
MRLSERLNMSFERRQLVADEAFRDSHRDPAYHELELGRKAIYKIRESYQERMAHAEPLFAILQRLIKRRAELEKSGGNAPRKIRRENPSTRTTVTVRNQNEETEVTGEQIGLAEQLDLRAAGAIADKYSVTISRDQLLRLMSWFVAIRVETVPKGVQRDRAPRGTMAAGAEAKAPWAKENGGNPDPRIALCGLEGEPDMRATWAVERWRAPRGYSTKEPRREVIWFSPYCLKPQAKLFDQDSHEQPELV